MKIRDSSSNIQIYPQILQYFSYPPNTLIISPRKCEAVMHIMTTPLAPLLPLATRARLFLNIAPARPRQGTRPFVVCPEAILSGKLSSGKARHSGLYP